MELQIIRVRPVSLSAGQDATFKKKKTKGKTFFALKSETLD